MPLTWKFDADQDRLAEIGIGEPATLTPEQVDEERDLTEAIIILMMVIGQSAITEDTWPEVYARIRFYENLTQPLLAHRPIGVEDVRRRIGLRTNVSRETRSVWVGRIAKGRLNEWVEEAKRAH